MSRAGEREREAGAARAGGLSGQGGSGRRPYLVSRRAGRVRYSSYDVIVVGGGIGGLTAAVGAARKWNVGLLTKSTIEDTTTFLAQGGIAAALGPLDSPELHLEDTLEAGAGLCDAQAVRILVREGPRRVHELEHLGTKFDRRGEQLVLASEGAHSVPRVVHAGGDATGSVVASALVEAMVSGSTVELHENEFVVDLLTDGGRCVGTLSTSGEGELTVSLARAVILASGGAGQLYSSTTNPVVATGDGHAMAYRAGAALKDMEFMQFHPTALRTGENPTFLVSEALRGEGAHLLDAQGERFMVGAHPQAELASRDAVVRRAKDVMERDGRDYVELDARHLDCDFLHERFPTICAELERRGYDLCREPVPVAPASHYYIGGVATDVWGRTTLPGLYACGEVAATGVHGANRLASNSLLEGLVYGDRIVRDLNRFLGRPERTVRKIGLDLAEDEWLGNSQAVVQEGRRELADIMARGCGIVRSRDELEEAERRLDAVRAGLDAPSGEPDELELYNLLTVASLMVGSASQRTESRGVHLRSDFPERDDENWKRHVAVRYDPSTEGAAMRVLEKEERGA